MTGNWLNTPEGKRARRWQRELARVIAHARVEPRSKNSITSTEAEAFQRSLADALGRRRGFRAPMMLELDFHAIADNPPEIHTVAKNYIDLAYRAPVGGGRLMKDDRQIHYLAVSYTLKMLNAPSMYVRAARMSGFREDVRLARELHHERDPDSSREPRLEEILDDLGRWEQGREHIVANYGQVMFDAHRRMQLSRVQQSWLAGTERMLHSILLDILSEPPVTPAPHVDFEGAQWRTSDFGDLYKTLLFSPLISLSLAPLPQKEGEGAGFKKAVEEALASVRAAHPRLFPLYTELAVAILLVPPAVADTRDSASIDLDNLARKVIPHVHRILEPPGARDFSYLGDVQDPGLKAYFEQRTKIARRLPKHHITRYEVFRLSRTTSDSPEGSVRLVLCDGAHGITFARFVHSIIDKSDSRAD